MKITFIGCGNMGEAILAGIHLKHTCYVCEPRLERQVELKKKYKVAFGMIVDAVKAADVIVLAVKPQDLPDVLAELRTFSLAKKLIISIAAGVTTKSIEKKLGQGVRVVRVMPNLPAMVGQGVSGVCRGAKATPKDVTLTQSIFNASGTTVVVPEKMINAVTAVSGSGPAYVFLFVECWIKAARKLGFSEKEAVALVYQTLVGSTQMLLKGEASPDVLRARVTSKGGTTQAAMDVFMTKGMDAMFEAALKAARDRAKELSN
ncbi:MAG: pyrroline-5-carboxylate reductase [Candidatus Omnitrophica bacterium]|nr:pyrroline-5-carboxylate reductase [Candidatus Omnitrophota bacterium]